MVKIFHFHSVAALLITLCLFERDKKEQEFNHAVTIETTHQIYCE